MKKYTILSAALLSLTTLPSFSNSLHALNKAETLKLLSGNTITTPVSKIQGEVVNNTFTGYFSKDGKMQAKFSNPLQNEPQADEGTWVIGRSGTFCVTWQHWGANKPHCMSFYKLVNGYVLVDNDSNSFESFIPTTGVARGNTMGTVN